MLRGSRATLGSLGEATAAAVLAGAIAGAAVGAIDALWSWDRLGQFVGLGGKLRALLYLSASYALAAALIAPVVRAIAFSITRATRLGDGIAALSDLHRRAPLARLSLAIALVPSVGIALVAIFGVLTPALAARKHFGLVVATSMAGGLVAIALGIVIGLLLARVIESALEAISRGPRMRRALASPTATLVALALVLAGGGAAILWQSWSTSSLLNLRPSFAILAIILFTIALRRPAHRIATRIRRLPIGAAATIALGLGVLMFSALQLGDSDGPRKAATAHSGLGGPIATGLRGIFDIDRDGHSRVLGGGDCDDWDDSIHPAAAEIPQDGIDNNCVGGDVDLTRDPTSAAFVPRPAGVPDDFNVVLITIDTLRADHLGSYGYKRDTSPALDALAAEGTLFENGWAHAPSTRYSIPAILTGRMPLAVDYFPIANAWPGIAASNLTIAETLKARGFSTGAILNYWYFEARRKMNQGFDHYDNKNRSLHKGVKGEGPAQTTGSSSKEQTDKAIEFVGEHQQLRANQPFFLWVHYYDPHYAYERHPGTKDFGDNSMALYDHEIRYTDDHIGRLIDDLKRRGLYDKTVFVITGDHGEGFGEHGIKLHGYHLYAAQTKVPLIIRVPGVAPRRVKTPAAHIDILPTLANLAGAKATTDMDGRSLLDLIGGAPEQDRVIFQQLSFENNNEMRAAASRDCHVIFNVSPHRSWETYEIASDPTERRDAPGSETCAPVRRALESFYDRSEIPRDAADALLDEKPVIESPLDAAFGDSATLLEAKVPTVMKRGKTGEIALTWRADDGFGDEWKVFVHIEGVGAAKPSFLQADHEPARPLRWWKRGQYIHYRRPLVISGSTKPGEYRVWVGLFKGKDRHPVSKAGKPLADNRVLVGTMRIER